MSEQKTVKIRHFGIDYPVPEGSKFNQIDAALYNFLNPQIAKDQGGPDVWRDEWFWFIVEYFWGKGAPKQFLRTPWAEEMALWCSWRPYVALSGCASSGKTDFGALWAIVNYLAKPLETKVLVTSTSLSEARRRIWGSVREYWLGNRFGATLPGKLLDSLGKIKFEAPGMSKAGSDKCGIELVACERSREKEAVGKLIGIKNSRVILIADEMPELTESLLEAAYGNLTSNPYFQLIGMGNFKSVLDPFGVFSEPKGGWASVNVNTQKWYTKRGVCIRFDGLKSPNFQHDEDKWPIYGRKQLAEHEKLGRNTVQFWRMCRSFPAPVGVADVIYSEAELMAGKAFETPLWSERRIIRLAALDPAFTTGGDRSILIVGSLGYDTEGRRVLCQDEIVELREDVTVSKPYDWQVADQFRIECEKRGIEPSNAAYDASGSGISFGTLLQERWSPALHGIKFGGGASELNVMSGDEWKPAEEVYVNRVSELWYQGKEYLRRRQLKGITRDLAEEITGRKYDIRTDKGTRIVVESKKDMKARMGRSPDIADAWMMLLELARVRHGFIPHGTDGSGGQKRDDKVPDFVERHDEVYDFNAIGFDGL